MPPPAYIPPGANPRDYPLQLARQSLADAFLRLDRAGEHLSNLETRIETFRASQKNKVTLLIEADRPGPGIRDETEEPPRIISVIAGEVVYNLRAALDYLVYALAWLDSCKHQPKTQFPIESSRKVFEGRRDTVLKGVSHEHVAAIQALQPFEGCNWIGLLRDASNQDKHWALAVTSAAYSGTIEIDPAVPSPVTEAYARAFTEGKVDVKHDPTIDVTFVNGPPVLKPLKALETEVRAVLQAFEPEFEWR
jgi:hypothetical protein